MQLSTLIAVDMYGCPVASVPQYRETLFEHLPNLEVLDGTDRNGEEASISGDLESDEEEEEGEEEDAKVREGFIDDEEDGDAEEDVDDPEDSASDADSSPQKHPKS